MGVTWAVAWAAVGLLIGVSSRLLPWLPWGAFFEVFDAPLMLLSAVSAAGSLTIARAGEDRPAVGAGASPGVLGRGDDGTA
jgi:hypothetical protein